MKIEFKTAQNGLVMEVAGERYVYQDGDSDSQDIERFADFLRTITDRYGPPTSRYSKERIYIVVEPGDKYEDTLLDD